MGLRSVRGVVSPTMCLIAGSLLLLVGVTSPASAHAERAKSTPKEGERVTAAPSELTITFTEPPAGNAKVSVLDGCDDEVALSREVSNLEIVAELGEGQPGKWKVSTTLVSGLDGHPTKDRWTFNVAGEADCSQEAAPAPAATEEETGDGGVPSILIIGAVGGLALVGLAVLFRKGRSTA